MKDEKSKFLKKFAVKGATEDFDAALKGKGEKIPSIVSFPSKKREADSDTESLENTLKPRQSNKKQKKQKHH